jgi:hypothetical protein
MDATDQGFSFSEAKSLQAEISKKCPGCTISVVRRPSWPFVVLGTERFDLRIERSWKPRPDDIIIRSVDEWNQLVAQAVQS